MFSSWKESFKKGVRLMRREVILPLPNVTQLKKIKVNTLLFTFCLAVLCFILLVLFLRFYIFEANVNLMYIDTDTDISQENELGHIFIVFSDGWNYFKSFNDSKLEIVNPIRVENPWMNNGYWIYSDKSNNNEASIQMSHFQRSDPQKVTLGIRFYIGGYARIDTTFISKSSKENLVIRHIDEVDGKDRAFCTKILQPLSTDAVEEIVIKVATFTPSSFVAIDKVVMTVGNYYQGLHMMYTLMPDQWCRRAKVESDTPMST